MTCLRLPVALFVLSATAACGQPSAADFGGGERGEIVAKCVSRMERADSAITRDQAGRACGCIADRTLAALERGQGVSSDAMVSCATNAGITIS